MKVCTRVRLKPSNDRDEFELDRARSKNNIAENSFALKSKEVLGKVNVFHNTADYADASNTELITIYFSLEDR